MEKYDYLKKYIGIPRSNDGLPFFPITKTEIEDAENKLGLSFPIALKEFWLSIGCGFCTRTASGQIVNEYVNRVMSPDQIASIMLKEEGAPIVPYILDEYEEYFPEGDIPFFEICDSSHFLVMKPNSEYPNGVYYDMGGFLVEKELETFIYNLYYWAPDYYIKLDDKGNVVNAVENREKNKS